MFYCNKRFLKINHINIPKTGIILVSGGGEGKADTAIASAEIVLKMLKCDKIYIAKTLNTDSISAREDTDLLKEIKSIQKQIFNI